MAIHPWDIALALESPPAHDDRNALPGAVGATTLHGGRIRVRIGPLIAEIGGSAPAAPERGAAGFAVFEAAAVRIVPLRLPSEPSDHEESS